MLPQLLNVLSADNPQMQLLLELLQLQRAVSFKVTPLVLEGGVPHRITDQREGRKPQLFQTNDKQSKDHSSSTTTQWSQMRLFSLHPCSLPSTGVVHRLSVINILHSEYSVSESAFQRTQLPTVVFLL